MSRPIPYSAAAMARKEVAAMRSLVQAPPRRPFFGAALVAVIVLGALAGALIGFAF